MSDIYLSITETPTVVTLTNPLISSNVAQSVTVTNVVSVNVVTMPAITVQAAAPAVTTVAGTVSISNFPSTQTIAGTVTAKIDGIDPTVIGNGGSIIQGIPGPDVNSIRTVLWSVDTNSDIGAEVGPSNPLPISGTVTANVVGTRTFVDVNAVTVSGFLAVGGWDVANSWHAPIPLNDGGTGVKISYDDVGGTPLQVANHLSGQLFRATVTVGNSVTIGSLPAISGTVTANNPSGALTTRFGSVTTANTAQITSAVTNTNRKYLLAQNISAGTVTIGIGFSPTTTQGIQLTAGGGLTFDAFCPTGAVYWLGAVTGAAWTILEG